MRWVQIISGLISMIHGVFADHSAKESALQWTYGLVNSISLNMLRIAEAYRALALKQSKAVTRSFVSD